MKEDQRVHQFRRIHFGKKMLKNMIKHSELCKVYFKDESKVIGVCFVL